MVGDVTLTRIAAAYAGDNVMCKRQAIWVRTIYPATRRGNSAVLRLGAEARESGSFSSKLEFIDEALAGFTELEFIDHIRITPTLEIGWGRI